MLLRQLLHILGRRDNAILLEDKFEGSAVSTLWAKTDSGGNLSVSEGLLRSAGGPGPQDGDPLLLSVGSWPRSAGRTLEFEITTSDISKRGKVGLTDGSNDVAEVMISGNNLVVVIAGANVISWTSAFIANSTSYWFRIVEKNPGHLVYMSTDGRATWFLLWEESTVTTTPLQIWYSNRTLPFTSQGVTLRDGTAKGATISGTAPAVTLAYGSDVVVNGGFAADANWTKDAGWTIADGVAHATAAGLNKAINESILTLGTWYKVVATILNRSAGGANLYIGLSNDAAHGADGTYTHIDRCVDDAHLYVNATSADTTLDVDNVSALPVALSSAISGGGDAGTKYGAYSAAVTVANYQAGLLCCLDSASTPANYLQAYVNRVSGKAYLLKCIGGTTTDLVSGDITYGAAKVLLVTVHPGSSGLANAQVQLFYDGTQVGSVVAADLSSGFGTLVRGFDTTDAATVALTVHTGIGVSA